MNLIDYSTAILVLGALVALTNIIVQVIKQVTWDKLPTQIVAVIVAQLLTIAGGIAWLQISDIAIAWYLIVALVVIGFMVAYAAMFGFEKLKEIIEGVCK